MTENYFKSNNIDDSSFNPNNYQVTEDGNIVSNDGYVPRVPSLITEETFNPEDVSRSSSDQNLILESNSDVLSKVFGDDISTGMYNTTRDDYADNYIKSGGTLGNWNAKQSQLDAISNDNNLTTEERDQANSAINDYYDAPNSSVFTGSTDSQSVYDTHGKDILSNQEYMQSRADHMSDQTIEGQNEDAIGQSVGRRRRES